MKTKHTLAALGWGPFFEKQIAEAERPDLIIARVTAVQKHNYLLENQNGELKSVISGRSLHLAEQESDLPVVGDWVLAKPPVGGTAVIVHRLERRSELSRRRPHDRNAVKTSSERQVLAGNLDYIFIVMSMNQDFNLARLERALVVVWNSGAIPVVLLSKSDLSADPEAGLADIQALACGVDVLTVSSLQGQGLETVRRYFQPGVTGCLIGSSGVGKTTLINALCGTGSKTLAIREDDGKGRHATTSRALFFLPEGGMLIDTPGLREIGVMDDMGLSAVFSDIAELAAGCKFEDCTHRVEPGCVVLTALAEGRLAQERYDSYLKLCRELDYESSKRSVGKQQEAKRKEKQLGKVIKEFYRTNHKRK